MRVVVTRSGGFAGIVTRAEADTDHDPELRTLVEQANLAALPPYEPQPDRYVYEIDMDGSKVQVGEANLTGPLRALVDRVLTTGRS